jgi:hypothetical protein
MSLDRRRAEEKRREHRCACVDPEAIECGAELVECGGRELLEFVGVHDMSSFETRCSRFLHDLRNPTVRRGDTHKG